MAEFTESDKRWLAANQSWLDEQIWSCVSEVFPGVDMTTNATAGHVGLGAALMWQRISAVFAAADPDAWAALLKAVIDPRLQDPRG